MNFYNDSQILVAVDGDACTYWSKDKSAWATGSVGWARDCWLDLIPISKAEAKKQFPEADFASIPDLGSSDNHDGNHGAETQAVITEATKADDLGDDIAVYVSKSTGGLAKAYVNPDRQKAAKVQNKVKTQLTRYLRAIGKDVAGQVREKLSAMGKADDDSDFDIEAFLDILNFDMFEDLEGDLATALGSVYGDSGRIAIAQMGVNDRGELVNQVNERAVSWAKEHAASLVGVSEDEKWSLPDSTRDMIRSTIANGMADNLSAEDIADQLEEAYAFSSERADLIAMTEIAQANSEGALDGYREAADIGVKVQKSWLMLEDACDVCQENADEGAIDLEEEFPSGDMTPPGHPNCRCVLVPEVDEGENEGDAEGATVNDQVEGLAEDGDMEDGGE